MKPVFVVNTKAYERSYGEALVALARDLSDAAHVKSVRCILCVPASEIRSVRTLELPNLEVYAQHVDAVPAGSYTGHVTPAMLLAAGAQGTLLNHSERRVEDVAAHVSAANAAGLKVVLCAQDTQEIQVFRNYVVEFLAVEPPELIGGDVSVSTGRPELIAASAKHAPTNLLVGAGVKNRSDVVKSVELGARGVLVASGIVKHAKPKEAFLELISGW
jgi:triosephosphate isomerase